MVDVRRLVVFLAEFTEKHGYPPAMREIKKGLGLSSLSLVSYWVNRAKGEGLLTNSEGKARTVVLTEKGKALGVEVANANQS